MLKYWTVKALAVYKPQATQADLIHATSGYSQALDVWRAARLRETMNGRVGDLILRGSGEFGTLEGLHNGTGDALRHAAASCQLTRDTDRPRARQVLVNHENDPDQSVGEQRMDARNNAVGQRLAGADGDCLDLAVSAYRNGELTTAPVQSQP